MPSQPGGRVDGDTRWLTATEQHAWRACLNGHLRLMAELNHQLQRDSDLSLAEYRILVLLSEAPDRSLRMSDLADGVLSSRSRLTHQIRRMESQRLVHRTSCVEDGRGVLAHLTDEGMHRLRTAAPGHVAAVRRDFVDLLTPQQLDAVADAFLRVEKEIGNRTD